MPGIIKSIFTFVLGFAIAAVLAKIIIGAAGPPTLIAGVVGGFAVKLLLGRKSKRLADSSYSAAEKSVHGHPIRTLLIWLFWFFILVAAMLIYFSEGSAVLPSIYGGF